MQKWITVAQFDSPHNAGIAKSKLESYGILCFLKNETLSAMQYPPLLAVELQVSSGDYKESIKILMDIGILKPNRKSDESASVSFLNTLPILNKLPSELRAYAFYGAWIILLILLVVYGVLKCE